MTRPSSTPFHSFLALLSTQNQTCTHRRLAAGNTPPGGTPVFCRIADSPFLWHTQSIFQFPFLPISVTKMQTYLHYVLIIYSQFDS